MNKTTSDCARQQGLAPSNLSSLPASLYWIWSIHGTDVRDVFHRENRPLRLWNVSLFHTAKCTITYKRWGFCQSIPVKLCNQLTAGNRRIESDKQIIVWFNHPRNSILLLLMAIQQLGCKACGSLSPTQTQDIWTGHKGQPEDYVLYPMSPEYYTLIL